MKRNVRFQNKRAAVINRAAFKNDRSAAVFGTGVNCLLNGYAVIGNAVSDSTEIFYVIVFHLAVLI